MDCGQYLKAAPSAKVIKLDLACGQSPREGFEGVDLWDGATHGGIDLQDYPWPWASNSVDELHCSHYIEHIPMIEVEQGGRRKDALFAFFDECYRILKPDGVLTVICPCARSNRAFQDPTHRRFIVAETFGYLSREWRTANKLDHYAVECDFGTNVIHTMPAELGLLCAEAQARRFNESWNTIWDWHATMKKKV